MSISIGFGVGPLRFRAPIVKSRRRGRGSSGGLIVLMFKAYGILLIGAVIAAVAGLWLGLFLLSLACAPLAGLMVGATTTPRTPKATASRYTKTTVDTFTKFIKKALDLKNNT